MLQRKKKKNLLSSLSLRRNKDRRFFIVLILFFWIISFRDFILSRYFLLLSSQWLRVALSNLVSIIYFLRELLDSFAPEPWLVIRGALSFQNTRRVAWEGYCDKCCVVWREYSQCVIIGGD